MKTNNVFYKMLKKSSKTDAFKAEMIRLQLWDGMYNLRRKFKLTRKDLDKISRVLNSIPDKEFLNAPLS